MKQPEVSVLIPVYNREDLIGACIQSALDQTFMDFEIVVVDNASTDRTWEICQGYAAGDDRICVFRNEYNIGPVRNWLAGLNVAKGTYVKILFSDDLMRPDCLELIMPLFGEDVAFVFSQVILGKEPWHGAGECCWQAASGIYDSSSFIDSSMYGSGGVPVSPCAAVFRVKDVIKALESEISIPNVNDFLDYGAGPDLYVYLSTAIQYTKIGYRYEMLTFFRDHPDSISSAKSDIVPERYAQTRIFFAGENLDMHQFHRVFMLEWLNAMKRQRRFIGLAVFHEHYCNNKHQIRFGGRVFVWAFIRIIGNVIRGRWLK